MRSWTWTLVVLTFVTGLLDAVTYLGLGHVFAANQTGNIIVLGFALVGSDEISRTASLASLAFFAGGAAISGWMAAACEGRPSIRWLCLVFTLEACLLGLALLTAALPDAATAAHGTVSILALAMGMRTVTVQRLGLNGVSTTVVTTMLATLAGQTLRARWRWDQDSLRIATMTAMLLGAASGAVLLRYGATPVLSLAALLSLGVAARLVNVRGLPAHPAAVSLGPAGRSASQPISKPEART